MKLKRLLTAALSAVMALSVCALPAMAEGATAATTPSNAVWTQNTGSITIHKYEFNGADNERKDATGENNDPVPDGANPLQGATFTAYQVWGENDLREYYNGASNKQLPTVASLTKTVNGNAVVRDERTTPKVAEGTTDASGIVTLNKDVRVTSSTGLPLGLYLVIETNSPASVTTRCTPFLVSVPMTRIGATKPSEEWLYDVHVYPKNKTTYGNITLQKYGRVGDTGTESALTGVTFELYKYNKTDDNVTAYTKNSSEWTKVVKSANSAGEGQGAVLNLKTDGSGSVTVQDLTQGYYCFVETDLGTNQKYILNQTPHYFKVFADSTSAPFTIVNNAVTVDTNNKQPNLTIKVVDTQPDIEKQVKNRNQTAGQDAWVDASDYSVGDEVPYTITIKVPHELLEAHENDDVVLTVKDTPKNLWVVENTIEAKPQGENTTKVTEGVSITPDTDATTDNGKGFTATFTKAALNALVGRGDTFVITYKAVLQSTAVMTVAGNPNDVSLKYSNKIGTDGKIDKGSEKEIHNVAVVYTFKINIEKRGESATGALLDGVMFDLYKLDNDNGTIVGNNIGFTDANKNSKFVKVKEGLTTVDGYVSATGLANGDYYLVETKTADTTYNLLSGPVKVKLDVQYQTALNKKEVYDSNGNLLHYEESKTTETFNNAVDTNSEGYTSIVVINRKGFNLPTTGGFGTLLFSGIGVLLVLAGVSVLFSLKKKNNRA